MATHRTCSSGILKPDRLGSFSTQNGLSYSAPSRFRSLFVGQETVQVSNCVLQEVQIGYKPMTLRMTAPTLDLDACKLCTGTCNTHEGMRIIWAVPEPCKPCFYEKLGIFEGSSYNRTWLSKKQDIALKFYETESFLVATCDVTMARESEQKFAIPVPEFEVLMHQPVRKRRVAPTIEQVSAQLNAIDLHINYIVQTISFKECIDYSVWDDATYTAKRLLNVTNIQARWQADNLLEVWQCSEVKS